MRDARACHLGRPPGRLLRGRGVPCRGLSCPDVQSPCASAAAAPTIPCATGPPARGAASSALGLASSVTRAETSAARADVGRRAAPRRQLFELCRRLATRARPTCSPRAAPARPRRRRRPAQRCREVDLEEEDALFSHSGAPRRAGVRAAVWSVAAALMLSRAAATLMLGAGGRRVSR